MIVNFNRENIEKLDGNGKVKKGVLGCTLLLTLTLLLTGCNRSMFDSKYGFDQALIFGDDSAIVLDVKNWKDYSGEQLQLNFNDNTGILTSFVNTTLVDPASDGITEIIAKAFSGSLEKDKGLVKVYK